MTAPTQADTTIWNFPFSQAEWEQTPSKVQMHLLALQTQLHDLQQRVGMMTAPTQADTTIWNFPFSQAEWEQTPSRMQVHLLALQTQLHDLQQQHQQLQSQG